MATALNNPRARFYDSDGNPLAFGKLYTWQAGTLTDKATFTTPLGDVSNTNPVVLDANGEANIWLIGSYQMRLVDINDVQQWQIDNISELLSAGTPAVFTTAAGVPTTLSANSFSLPGDITGVFKAGTRVKYVTTTVTRYGTTSIDATFGAGVTTVTLSFTTGTLVSGTGVSAAYGNGDPNFALDSAQMSYTPELTSVSAALADRLRLSTGGAVMGTLTMSGAAINEAKGADIASAATINLDTAAGNLVNVTGTTNITAITLAEGRARTVRFISGLTLVHSAGLSLPRGTDLVAAADDFVVFRGFAGGVVRVQSAQLANNPGSAQFTPAVTALLNCSATANTCGMLRVQGVVYFFGRLNVSTVAGGGAQTRLRVSLPVASNLEVNSIFGGAGVFIGDATGVGAAPVSIIADVTNEEFILQFASTIIASSSVEFSVGYVVSS